MGTYLGLPENISGSKKRVFAFIHDRLSKRINTWSAKLLSKGGKEVMIKSVAQALPTYVMSCFLLPQETIKKLQGAISKFWWSSKQNNRGLHWIAWEKICLPMDEGGLGFRDLKNFNLALLAKQLWRIIQYPSSLLARILKGRYFWHSNPLDVGKANSPSYGWTSMIAARELLRAGLRKSIGSGANTAVWRDPWLPLCPPRPPKSNGGFQDPYLLAYHLIDQRTKTWNTEYLRQLFTEDDVRWIQCIKPSRTPQSDRLVWAYTKSGVYTVKSGYDLAMQLKENVNDPQVLEPSTKILKKNVWKIRTSKKLKHFMWQCLTGCIAVRDRLVDRHCGTDRTCPRCDDATETVNHLLFECPAAIQVWTLANIPITPGVFPCNALYTNFDHLLWRAKEAGAQEKHLARFPWIFWFLWKARNEKIFDGTDTDPLDTIQLATAESESWFKAQPTHKAGNDGTATSPNTTRTETGPSLPRCQVDASWGIDDHYSGGGFVLEKEDGGKIYGAVAMHQVLSPLHAELAALLWTMKTISELGMSSINLETDCMQLVKLVEEEEFWPSLASELDELKFIQSSFDSFSISYIPRLCNVRADCLSKGARARGSLFSYVNFSIPSWLAHEACFLGSI